MASIFSTQNLQTFLRRKYFRPPGPPSRPPPGPPGRDGRRSPRSGRSPPEDDSDVDLVSSAMLLLKISRWSLVVRRWHSASVRVGQRPKAKDQRRLLRRSRRSFPGRLSRWRRRCGFALGILDRLDLIQPLLLLVDANSKELDDRLGHPQAPLQFMN